MNESGNGSDRTTSAGLRGFCGEAGWGGVSWEAEPGPGSWSRRSAGWRLTGCGEGLLRDWRRCVSCRACAEGFGVGETGPEEAVRGRGGGADRGPGEGGGQRAGRAAEPSSAPLAHR